MRSGSLHGSFACTRSRTSFTRCTLFCGCAPLLVAVADHVCTLCSAFTSRILAHWIWFLVAPLSWMDHTSFAHASFVAVPSCYALCTRTLSVRSRLDLPLCRHCASFAVHLAFWITWITVHSFRSHLAFSRTRVCGCVDLPRSDRVLAVLHTLSFALTLIAHIVCALLPHLSAVYNNNRADLWICAHMDLWFSLALTRTGWITVLARTPRFHLSFLLVAVTAHLAHSLHSLVYAHLCTPASRTRAFMDLDHSPLPHAPFAFMPRLHTLCVWMLMDNMVRMDRSDLISFGFLSGFHRLLDRSRSFALFRSFSRFHSLHLTLDQDPGLRGFVFCAPFSLALRFAFGLLVLQDHARIARFLAFCAFTHVLPLWIVLSFTHGSRTGSAVYLDHLDHALTGSHGSRSRHVLCSSRTTFHALTFRILCHSLCASPLRLGCLDLDHLSFWMDHLTHSLRFLAPHRGSLCVHAHTSHSCLVFSFGSWIKKKKLDALAPDRSFLDRLSWFTGCLDHGSITLCSGSLLHSPHLFLACLVCVWDHLVCSPRRVRFTLDRTASLPLFWFAHALTTLDRWSSHALDRIWSSLVFALDGSFAVWFVASFIVHSFVAADHLLSRIVHSRTFASRLHARTLHLTHAHALSFARTSDRFADRSTSHCRTPTWIGSLHTAFTHTSGSFLLHSHAFRSSRFLHFLHLCLSGSHSGRCLVLVLIVFGSRSNSFGSFSHSDLRKWIGHKHGYGWIGYGWFCVTQSAAISFRFLSPHSGFCTFLVFTLTCTDHTHSRFHAAVLVAPHTWIIAFSYGSWISFCAHLDRILIHGFTHTPPRPHVYTLRCLVTTFTHRWITRIHTTSHTRSSLHTTLHTAVPAHSRTLILSGSFAISHTHSACTSHSLRIHSLFALSLLDHLAHHLIIFSVPALFSGS